jgi:hypothetical protein
MQEGLKEGTRTAYVESLIVPEFSMGNVIRYLWTLDRCSVEVM